MTKLILNLISFITIYAMFGSAVYAQGQDSTPAERDIMILSEMLPGLYDNANQSYFDVRLKQPKSQRHEGVYSQISRVATKQFDSSLGDYVFRAEIGWRREDSSARFYAYALQVDNEVQAVRMKIYRLKKAASEQLELRSATYMAGCDVLWRQEAGQFRAKRERVECSEDEIPADFMLSRNALWLDRVNQLNVSDSDDVPKLSHYALDRARTFDCYADVPGVGGGRDIPFERYQLNGIHDLGGEQWFVDKEGKEIGISLFRVMWTFNNYDGVFARPSFVVYVKTKLEDGKVKELGYSWTEPSAQRIGINLKWMLVNCYMLSNSEVVPFYKNDEPKL